jgi:transposase
MWDLITLKSHKMEDKKKPSASSLVREIKRRTRRTFSAEQKIQIVLEGIRGEESVSAICRKYGIHENNYYNWSKDFMEAGKKRLSGDTERDANTSEVKDLKEENGDLKDLVAELSLQVRILKKSLRGLD